MSIFETYNLGFPVNFYPNFDLLCAGGIQVRGFKGNEIARQRNQADPVLEKYEFVPYICNEVSSCVVPSIRYLK